MSAENPGAQPHRVLIVDDDQDLLESMGLMFRKRGFEAFIALDAESALQAIASIRPHLVLTDLRLPRKSGLDLVRDIHALYPNIAVLIMTAYGSDEVLETAQRLGTTVLTKPVQRDELFRSVGRVLAA